MTQTPTYDVLGIGNAIVDVIAPVDEAFLQKHSLIKGSMALVDEARSDLLYAAFPPAQERSGGSAANTLAGLASFGGKGAFAGKVAEDVLGHVFTHDMRNGGVAFDVSPLKKRTLHGTLPCGSDPRWRADNEHLPWCSHLFLRR